MSLHLRLQHGALILAALGALGTGYVIAGSPVPAGMDLNLWYRVHQWSGMAALTLIGYHATYLFVRGYIEGRNWSTFPLGWKKGDWTDLRRQAGYLLGGEDERPEADLFRPSQKALYWGTGLLLTGLSLTGIGVGLWEHFGSYSLLPTMGLLAHLHRGLALLLLAVALWHLYGVLTWDGRFVPQWTWITGFMSEELAAAKVAGHYRAFQIQEQERLASTGKKTAKEAEEDERSLEKETVEEELKAGNLLAKEKKYVDALFHYRRALERYPGYSQARYNMAVVLRKMGERAMAVENFRQFVKDDPFHPLARRAQESAAEIEKEEEL
jgi:tetratricopeptide (TPR) repeat protein